VLLDFAEQDFRDEISGDDEKHVYANKAARKPRFIRERVKITTESTATARNPSISGR
jgi:hypothetical protein